MNESQYTSDFEEESIDIKGELLKYIRFWPWFVLTAIFSLSSAFLILRYSDTIYNTQAKIKIIDDQEAKSVELDIASFFKNSVINLENEMALFTSYRLLEKVVESLDLNVSYFQTGTINTQQKFNAPFKVNYNSSEAQKKILEFSIEVTNNGYLITNTETLKSINSKGFTYEGSDDEFPIKISPVENADFKTLENPNYQITLNTVKASAIYLKEFISVVPEGDDSDLLVISLDYINGLQAESILNTLIKVYEADGIRDRQEVSKQTIAFIDERFGYLLSDLDSIEIGKQKYKQANNISFIEADAGLSIQKRSLKQEALFAIETQLLLSEVLKNSLVTTDGLQLLPANIGIESTTINKLVGDYNSSLLAYEKLKTSAGINNPTVSLLEANTKDLKNNISRSITGYVEQLNTTLAQNTTAQEKANTRFSSLPEQEKALRKIERQQTLKENLYLLLLQKREEAAISYAVTVSNVKVIDYAITNPIPIAPKKKLIYLGALLIGLLIPFGILYLKFLLNNKILGLKDLKKLIKDTPILVEVPLVSMGKTETTTEIQEVFRTLIQNLLFISPKKTDEGTSILVTSSVKGEGKTFIAYNLAKGLAKNKKKVLLLGADVRNPKMHQYLNVAKTNKGFVDYIADDSIDYKPLIKTTKKEPSNFDILISGTIPPNPSVVLEDPRFEDLLEKLKASYDFIVVDSAPTLLVSDTLAFAPLMDTSLFVVRSEFTEQQIITFSQSLIADKKIKNAAYILNGIDFANNGYGYGYGYNYGYGYGYGDISTAKRWYEFLKIRKPS